MLGHSGSDDKHYNGMNWRGKIGWFYFYYTSLYHNAIWRRIAESRHFWSMFNEVKLLFRIEQKRNSITRHHHRIPNCFTVYDSGNVATSSIRYPSSNSTWLLCFFFLNHLTAETTRAKSVDARRMLVRLSPLRHIKRTTYFIIIYCSLMQVSYDRFFFFVLFSVMSIIWPAGRVGTVIRMAAPNHIAVPCMFNVHVNSTFVLIWPLALCSLSVADDILSRNGVCAAHCIAEICKATPEYSQRHRQRFYTIIAGEWTQGRTSSFIIFAVVLCDRQKRCIKVQPNIFLAKRSAVFTFLHILFHKWVSVNVTLMNSMA